MEVTAFERIIDNWMSENNRRAAAGGTTDALAIRVVIRTFRPPVTDGCDDNSPAT